MRYDYRAMLNQKKDLEDQYKSFSKNLSEVEKSVNSFKGIENFEGKFAESTKQYMAEVHLILPALLNGYFKDSISKHNKKH